jgi:hypothetical protein
MDGAKMEMTHDNLDHSGCIIYTATSNDTKAA